MPAIGLPHMTSAPTLRKLKTTVSPGDTSPTTGGLDESYKAESTSRHNKLNKNRTSLSLLILSTSILVVILASLLSCRSLTTRFSPLIPTSLRHHLPNSFLHSFATTTQLSHPSTAGSMSFTKELRIAQLAVQRATILTKRVFLEKAKGTTNKDDKSPVTIGDFGAQALIISALKHSFPADEIVAEEEADDLRTDEPLRNTIWDLVRTTQFGDAAGEAELGGAIKDVDSMLDIIDLGKSKGGNSGRIWTIDPIDGTKGFLRGGQYAVCLGLMVDGDVKVGVLGCPNLPVDDAAPLTADMGSNQTDEGMGVVFSAVLGQGATSHPFSTSVVGEGKPISMKPLTNMGEATFCESVEAGHSSHGDQADISKKLGVTKPSVRMDSQAKYGSIARGAGDIYLRLPVKKTYQEKIWDHAAGDLIVREAGGQVTDVHGKRLDFSVGRTLANNKGVVAAPKDVHWQILKVVQEVLGVGN